MLAASIVGMTSRLASPDGAAWLHRTPRCGVECQVAEGRPRRGADDLYVTAPRFTGTLYRSMLHNPNLTLISQEDQTVRAAIAPQFKTGMGVRTVIMMRIYRTACAQSESRGDARATS